MRYSMQCTCGESYSVDAADKDEGIVKIKEMMSEESVKKHMEENHPGEPVPSREQLEMMIEHQTQEEIQEEGSRS